MFSERNLKRKDFALSAVRAFPRQGNESFPIDHVVADDLSEVTKWRGLHESSEVAGGGGGGGGHKLAISHMHCHRRDGQLGAGEQFALKLILRCLEDWTGGSSLDFSRCKVFFSWSDHCHWVPVVNGLVADISHSWVAMVRTPCRVEGNNIHHRNLALFWLMTSTACLSWRIPNSDIKLTPMCSKKQRLLLCIAIDEEVDFSACSGFR